jgi:DNA-binding NarL/FixJ family response regulator
VLRTVDAGHLCLASVAARWVRPSLEPPAERLTARELDVLRLLAVGHQNAEIAAELCVCVKTVESHVSSVLQKLGVRSRTEAALEARERGLA